RRPRQSTRVRRKLLFGIRCKDSVLGPTRRVLWNSQHAACDSARLLENPRSSKRGNSCRHVETLVDLHTCALGKSPTSCSWPRLFFAPSSPKMSQLPLELCSPPFSSL